MARFSTLAAALLCARGLVHGFAPTPAHVRSIPAPRRFLAAAAKKDDPEAVTFRKPDFVASVAEKTGWTKKESEAALAAVLETIQEEVAAGKKIQLLGFGNFKLNHRKGRKGRNPRTGEEIQIKASNTPSFTASKAFKDMVNQDR
mmetsp:Transcript_29095/g.66688  ORF Transcript_29095/g.66688 Transcript_29095/m.66688 type:complete len:145 (-) Transcript_29095:68-502(-)|eukprot:CAMPEP_0113317534 /NCGR_PEP_ID=MMETSP0010_2-20120614/12404_1 /TAXON_ID=216773 ORGANISM="Corethron hystrix, Strain 308" /NCGR_SAMPLE_ID=MMETSP0010_2 /ASSEMBLY_ACC=CAM_ASM_000155 /LENGTH=144 /DNA_ID=CAMNT_0000174535 /DNA_START=124 /DNA_END=558 /DNA_ORIENTATION=- /assembly_acc=CAM_ASM_000155